MGIIARQSIFNAAYTYLGILLGVILTLFLYPYILEPEQYGLTRVLVSASIIGAQFAHLGMRNTVIRFFPFFKNPEKNHSGLLFWAITIPLAGFLIFATILWLFREPLIGLYAERSPIFADYFMYILPLTFFILYFDILNNYLRSLQDSTTGSMVSEVMLRVAIILMLGIYFTGWISFSTFILLFALAYGLQPIWLIITLLKTGELNLRPDFTFMRRSVIRGMTSYGLYTFLGGVTTVIVWNVDIMMLGSMSGLEQTAIYAIAFYIGTVITVPQRAIDKITTPVIAGLIKHKKNWPEVNTIYRKTSLNQFIAGVLILALIWTNIDMLLSLLPEVYADGKWVVLFIGLGKLFDMATGANGSIIITSKYYRYDLLFNLLLVIFTVTLNLLLIPRYGINGAAIATMLSIFLYNLIKYLFVWLRFSMQPFTPHFLTVALLASASMWIVFQIPDISPFTDILVRSATLLILFLIPVWWFGISEDANRILRQITDQILARKP
ncbi:MAG: lipopolysaccharide biosynthesis protein [Cyclonatronaceae bacterium]